MVQSGYILPQKNIDARLEALKIGLKNQNLKNLNAQLNLNKYSPLTLTSNVPTITEQTGQPQQMPPTKEGVDISAIYKELPELEKARGSEVSASSSIPVLTSGISQTPEERATKSAIEAKKRELKRELTDQEKADVVSNISKTKTLLTEISTKSKKKSEKTPAPSNLSSLATTWISSVMPDFNNLQDGEQEAIRFQEGFDNIKSEDEYLNYVNQFKDKRYAINLTAKQSNNPYFGVPLNSSKIKKLSSRTSDDTLKTSYKYFKNNKDKFNEQLKSDIQKEFGVIGSGLKGGAIRSPYYSQFSPNFGNLHLMERSLKRNQLTIYRPYSKITVASKSSITPLLKKMILDIQNTLEFDQRDYNNLEADEKRIIEKIIRSQKNMKNYNIQSLIDQDDLKMKKRLEILVGQINAGNNSTLIREEMKALLKRLYDNRAISLNKYRNSLKAIKALES